MSDIIGSAVKRINIEEELKQSYLDYAMSVIVGRALPDVRDGLKPVHRRVLFAMNELGNLWNRPYKKSARVVGDVIGKYHPHGDGAVYDTIVRMAQPFSLRYLLVDGQGNFGSVDGDSPAAMRYTEVRMTKMAQWLLEDLEKETVDYVPNYDETELIPQVLPTRVPNLLINGTAGIAVGMATNIPPHNLGEIVNACIALIDDSDLSVDDLMTYVPGPDFPTAGIINGRAGIASAYRTGRGRIYIRAKTHIETDKTNGKDSIIITELPYQVNKARLIEKIAELVKDKKIDGITELRDESDQDGMRVVIELRRGEVSEVTLNNLFSQTQMQSVFGINMVALVDNQPKLLNLKQALEFFIRHRQSVVTRRTIFDLRKARERAHILEGLGIALSNIDEMIALIKSSPNSETAKQALLSRSWKPGIILDLVSKTDGALCRPEGLAPEFGLNDNTYRLSLPQVEAILDLKLNRLTGLEQDKILSEYQSLLEKVRELLAILNDHALLMKLIREELLQVKEEFGDARRTEISESHEDLTLEDLITEEDMVVTLSQEGYVKAQPISVYQAQRRGGRGKAATTMKEEDVIDQLAVASSHDTMLCFSNYGKVYWTKVYQFPQAGRTSRGKPINNILNLEADERINAMLGVRHYDQRYVLMVTANGVVKKTPLEQFSRPRVGGIWAIHLDEGDKLIAVALTDGNQSAMLFSDAGKAVRFKEKDVRPMGRTARGVRGIRLQPKQKVISLVIIPQEGCDILTATENGYGKRTCVSEYREVARGAQGVMSIQTTERNGKVVSALAVTEQDEMMLITNGGVLVRIRAAEVSRIGRNTQGVRLINLSNNELLIGAQKVAEIQEGEEFSTATTPVVASAEISEESEEDFSDADPENESDNEDDFSDDENGAE